MDEIEKQLYIDLYRENQTFIEKVLFTISLAALPVILKLNEKLDCIGKIPAGLSFLLFSSILCLQFYTHVLAKKGCDLALSSEKAKQNKAKKMFKYVRKFEKPKYYMFAISLILLLLTYFHT